MLLLNTFVQGYVYGVATMQGNMPVDFLNRNYTGFHSQGPEVRSSNSKQKNICLIQETEITGEFMQQCSMEEKTPPNSTWRAAWVNECTWPDVQKAHIKVKESCEPTTLLTAWKHHSCRTAGVQKAGPGPFACLTIKVINTHVLQKANMLSIKLYNSVSHDPPYDLIAFCMDTGKSCQYFLFCFLSFLGFRFSAVYNIVAQRRGKGYLGHCNMGTARGHCNQ